MGLVIIPNLICLIILFPQVRQQTKDYFSNPKVYPQDKNKGRFMYKDIIKLVSGDKEKFQKLKQ